jgi:hypothetical protein
MARKIGTYGSMSDAQKLIDSRESVGMFGRFSIKKEFKGVSVDRAYSDKTGHSYSVYLHSKRKEL